MADEEEEREDEEEEDQTALLESLGLAVIYSQDPLHPSWVWGSGLQGEMVFNSAPRGVPSLGEREEEEGPLTSVSAGSDEADLEETKGKMESGGERDGGMEMGEEAEMEAGTEKGGCIDTEKEADRTATQTEEKGEAKDGRPERTLTRRHSRLRLSDRLRTLREEDRRSRGGTEDGTRASEKPEVKTKEEKNERKEETDARENRPAERREEQGIEKTEEGGEGLEKTRRCSCRRRQAVTRDQNPEVEEKDPSEGEGEATASGAQQHAAADPAPSQPRQARGQRRERQEETEAGEESREVSRPTTTPATGQRGRRVAAEMRETEAVNATKKEKESLKERDEEVEEEERIEKPGGLALDGSETGGCLEPGSGGNRHGGPPQDSAEQEATAEEAKEGESRLPTPGRPQSPITSPGTRARGRNTRAQTEGEERPRKEKETAGERSERREENNSCFTASPVRKSMRRSGRGKEAVGQEEGGTSNTGPTEDREMERKVNGKEDKTENRADSPSYKTSPSAVSSTMSSTVCSTISSPLSSPVIRARGKRVTVEVEQEERGSQKEEERGSQKEEERGSQIEEERGSGRGEEPMSEAEEGVDTPCCVTSLLTRARGRGEAGGGRRNAVGREEGERRVEEHAGRVRRAGTGEGSTVTSSVRMTRQRKVEGGNVEPTRGGEDGIEEEEEKKEEEVEREEVEEKENVEEEKEAEEEGTETHNAVCSLMTRSRLRETQTQRRAETEVVEEEELGEEEEEEEKEEKPSPPNKETHKEMEKPEDEVKRGTEESHPLLTSPMTRAWRRRRRRSEAAERLGSLKPELAASHNDGEEDKQGEEVCEKTGMSHPPTVGKTKDEEEEEEGEMDSPVSNEAVEGAEERKRGREEEVADVKMGEEDGQTARADERSEGETGETEEEEEEDGSTDGDSSSEVSLPLRPPEKKRRRRPGLGTRGSRRKHTSVSWRTEGKKRKAEEGGDYGGKRKKRLAEVKKTGGKNARVRNTEQATTTNTESGKETSVRRRVGAREGERVGREERVGGAGREGEKVGGADRGREKSDKERRGKREEETATEARVSQSMLKGEMKDGEPRTNRGMKRPRERWSVRVGKMQRKRGK